MLFEIQAQKISVKDYENKAQAYAILSAQYSKDGYFYARRNYFNTSKKLIKLNADTGMVSMRRAVEFADSALIFANDTDFVAIARMKEAKKYQEQSLNLFNRVRSEEDNSEIIGLCGNAMYAGGNAVADAYNASLSFTSKLNQSTKMQEKVVLNEINNNNQSENLIEEKPTLDRDITRLEVDEFSYMTIKELYGKRLVEIDDELVLLNASAQKSKGVKLQEINKAIDQLKIEEKECFEKMKGSEDRLINVRNELSEEMLYIVQKDIFTSEKEGFYNDKVPIPNDYKIPDGLVYRVQIGFFKSQLPSEHFEGIFPLSSQKVDDTYYRYVAGNFARYNDAREGKISITSKGYKDSFVVAYFDGKKISISEALKLEKGLN